MNKKTLSIIFAYVGVLTGAGLASGQELMQYFLSFGLPGLYGIAVVGVLHVVVGGIVLQLGSHFVAQSHIDVLDEVTSTAVTKLMDYALIVNCFLMGFVMIAGAGSNLEQQFGLAPWVGSLLCTALIIVVGMLDFDKVAKIIGAFTPLVLVFTLIGAAFTMVKANPNPALLDALGKSLTPAVPYLPLSTINYFGLCMISGISMAFVLGGSKTDSAQARVGGMLGGALVATLTGLVGVTLFLALEIVKDADIPMQTVLDSVHPVMGLAMSVIIFGMIFNTGMSLFYSAARRLSVTEGTFKRNLIVFTLAGFGLSFLGFKKLMGILYPILGYLGLILILILIGAWIRERSEIKSEIKKRKKLTRLTRKKLDDDEEFSKKDDEKLEKLAEASIIDDKRIKKAVAQEVAEELEEKNDE